MKKRLVCLLLALALMLPLMPSACALTDLSVYALSSFDKGYAVYSGPGVYYYRANDGQAYYSWGAVRVYGVCGDWVMIGYGYGNGLYRIGYVSSDCLQHTKYVNGTINYNLTFNGVTAYPNNNCYITDDPVQDNAWICKIPQGQPVTALGVMGNWTYIEVQVGTSYMRGFVYSFTLSYNGAAPSIDPTPTPAPYVPPTATPYVAPTPVPYVAPTATPYVPPTATPAPALPNTFYHDTSKGIWLPSYQRVTFSSSWPVYSGPGEYYYRAANGRALMGGGSCIVYGVENGWVLIGYTLSNGNFRIGYIRQEALPQQGLYIPYLDLNYTIRQLTYPASLTDDIIRYRPTVATLPAGTYVLLLGYVYESYTTWAYVEVLVDNNIMRGFIPITSF